METTNDASSRDSDASPSWAYASVPLAGTSDVLAVTTTGNISGLSTILYRPSTTSAATLGSELVTYKAPTFLAVNRPSTASLPDAGQFAFAYRLRQPTRSSVDRSWVYESTDFRSNFPFFAESISFSTFDPSLDPVANLNPNVYQENVDTVAASADYLIHRRPGLAANDNSDDTPIFELPRRPLLSLGELQTMANSGAPLFSIGNSWGSSWKPGHPVGAASVNGNQTFDRFFFSGLASPAWGPDLARNEPLPNWNLVPVDVPAPLTYATLRDNGNPLSSRYLLQRGGFNLNSTSQAAWSAVLSRVRFSATEPFRADTAGTGESFLDSTLSANASGPTFFRFPQTAQATFVSVGESAPGRAISADVFKKGVRGGSEGTVTRALTSRQIDALAAEIVTLVKAKGAEHGPFRSVAHFLGPMETATRPSSGTQTVAQIKTTLLDNGRISLIEQAIQNVGSTGPSAGTVDPINPPELRRTRTVSSAANPGFSSATLSQGDIMTALAPYLRTRSDTFVVRTYGDVVNPATGVVEGRAYAEAIVQRFPTPVDAADSATPSRFAQPAGDFGRRFKVISFRWLSPLDI